jgi:transposase-like protein
MGDARLDDGHQDGHQASHQAESYRRFELIAGTWGGDAGQPRRWRRSWQRAFNREPALRMLPAGTASAAVCCGHGVTGAETLRRWRAGLRAGSDHL